VLWRSPKLAPLFGREKPGFLPRRSVQRFSRAFAEREDRLVLHTARPVTAEVEGSRPFNVASYNTRETLRNQGFFRLSGALGNRLGRVRSGLFRPLYCVCVVYAHRLFGLFEDARSPDLLGRGDTTVCRVR
jgi:hypothetical protein